MNAGLVWDRDRAEHSTHRRDFVTHSGIVAFRPTLRTNGKGKNWCRFVIFEQGITLHRDGGQHRWQRKWAVYVWGDQAEWACECIRQGDRVMVYGLERGRNAWVNENGEREEIDDLAAWELGMSMRYNPAYSERNEPTRRHRSMRAVEEGRAPIPDGRHLPLGPPP